MLGVGINLLWLVPGVVGGSEEYTVRLLAAMDEQRPASVNVRIYGRRSLFEAHRELADRFEAVVAPPMPESKVARVGLEATWLRGVSKQDALVHHAGGVVVRSLHPPPVLTVHDIQPLDMPHHFGWVKRRWLGSMLPRSVQAARLIITPSQFTADRLIDELGAIKERIAVVSHGHREPPGQAVSRDSICEPAQSYGRFVLYPAIAYPHKRHIDLIDALGQLSANHRDLSVVFTGRPGPLYGELQRRVARLGLDQRVHFTGRISEAALDGLYRTAVATVIPSEYEGFGNPALEAMARGCPVVAANAGALPEVIGESGLLVPPRSPEALADAIASLLDNKPLAHAIGDDAKQQAARYCWESSGRRLVDCYRQVATETGSQWPSEVGPRR